MNLDELLPESTQMEFRHRPVSIPGDLRTSWRLALIIFILGQSRGQKASLSKLHLLSDALRSSQTIKKLGKILNGELQPSDWRIRVEPALGRALDFAMGERLISFENGPSFKLTSKGRQAASILNQRVDLLTTERDFLVNNGHGVSESFVKNLVRMQG